MSSFNDSDSDSEQSATCKTLHRFSDLPVEIRLNIWEIYCLSTIRNIALEVDVVHPEVPSNPQDTRVYPVIYKYHSGTSHPPILHVCREARAEGLKYYDLSFGVTFVHELSNYKYFAPPRIYINWAIDRLVILRPYQFWCLHNYTHRYTSSPHDGITMFKELLTTKKLKRLAYNCLQESEGVLADHIDEFDPDAGDEHLDLIYPERSSIDEVIFFEFKADEENVFGHYHMPGLSGSSLPVFMGAVDIKFLELSWEGVPQETYYPATWLSEILENRKTPGGVENMPEMRLAYVVINDEPAEPQNLGPLEENRVYII
jgi:hypothetical protein